MIPLCVLGGGLLGVAAARWLPWRGAPLIVFVAVFAWVVAVLDRGDLRWTAPWSMTTASDAHLRWTAVLAVATAVLISTLRDPAAGARRPALDSCRPAGARRGGLSPTSAFRPARYGAARQIRPWRAGPGGDVVGHDGRLSCCAGLGVGENARELVAG